MQENPYINKISFRSSNGEVLSGNRLKDKVQVLAIKAFVKAHKAGIITSVDLGQVEFA